MNIGTKYYGTVAQNARFNCPQCGDRKGRFYVYIGSGAKHGKCFCHNCGFRGVVEDVAGKSNIVESMFEQEEESTLGPLVIQSREDKTGRLLAFLKRRVVESPPWGVKAAAVAPYQFRMALPALSLRQGLEFWNFRWFSESSVEKKVLFPSSMFNNIAKKSESVLWNPGVVPPRVTPNPCNIIPVIVEGDMGAWSVYHRGGGEAFIGVAVFGSFISIEQARYFSHFHKVFYMPDADVSFEKIKRNLNVLTLAGIESVYVYDKSQYVGLKDDANDIQMRTGGGWFAPSSFQRCSF